MTNGVAVYELGHRLRRLYDCLLMVHMTVAKDIPEAHQVGERLGELLQDLLDGVVEGLTAVAELPAMSDLQLARQMLFFCHQRCCQLEADFWLKVVVYEQMADLLQVGRERGGEWRTWSLTVKSGLEGCGEPLLAVLMVLPLCWQEVVARGTAVPLTILNSSFAIQHASFSDLFRTQEDMNHGAS